MKAVILAGGFGTRLSEETHLKPKPMVEIGGKPILWHIMKLFSANNINDFVICCGYKGYVIKEYFANYYLHNCDVTFNFGNNNQMQVHRSKNEPWSVSLIDTGENSMTAGRLRRVKEFLGDEPFCFTYGDGLADIDIGALRKHHDQSNSMVTLTAVKPPGRYGALNLEKGYVKSFKEKPDGDNSWINGGFFVVNPKAINYIKSDASVWETDVLPQLSQSNQLSAFPHSGFWQPMDTLRDKNYLEKLWESGSAPWKLW